MCVPKDELFDETRHLRPLSLMAVDATQEAIRALPKPTWDLYCELNDMFEQEDDEITEQQMTRLKEILSKKEIDVNFKSLPYGETRFFTGPRTRHWQ